MISRNEALGIVERTRKNLVHMRDARQSGADVHEVTHLFNSLLGLIVIPWERELKRVDVLDIALDALFDQGWPRIDPLPDEYPVKTETLKVLVKHLRNAVAHGRFRFEGVGSNSANSREPSEVKVVVCDQMTLRETKEVVRWRAEIGGEDLYRFCDRFIEYIGARAVERS